MTTKSNDIVERLTNLMLNQMYIGQTLVIKAKLIEANFVKNNVSLLDPNKVIQDIEINFSSYCDLLSSTSLSSNCNNQVISQKVIS
jgi:hypothetical protein